MIYTSNGRKAYGIKSFIFDTYEDMLKEQNMHTGDTAFIIDSSKYYMFSHKKIWKEIYPQGNPEEDVVQHVIYDGGIV